MSRADERGTRKEVMKKLCIASILIALLAGCTSKTAHGPCIGAFDDRAPGVEYRMSVMNDVIAVIFVETIFVPVVVVAEQTMCPVGPSPIKK